MENEKQNSEHITTLLQEWKNGNKDAFDDLFPYVYSELRRRAVNQLRNERPGHTLQTTALINEVYLKLSDKEIDWESRSHFYAIASKAMRRILVDHARARKRKKRGGKDENLSLDEARHVSTKEKGVDLIALDAALNRLAEFDERQSNIVELRYFSGLSVDETAKILNISNATVRRDWNVAKAWLHQQLS